MDIANSLAPRSDQINADDLVAGPQTFTIREVVGGKAEQPFDFLLVETDRAFRPAVTMRRLIAAAWGTNGDAYVGRRLTVYRDPTIRFGKDVVGGIRISHMSHIDKRVEVKLQVTRGKRETFAVDPLPATAPPKDWDAVLSTALGLTDVDELKALWARELVGNAPAEVQTAITARVAEIKAAAEVSPEDAFPAEGVTE